MVARVVGITGERTDRHRRRPPSFGRTPLRRWSYDSRSASVRLPVPAPVARRVVPPHQPIG
ncbi:hypothetical protein GPN2_22391 [Streptomyces murinus]